MHAGQHTKIMITEMKYVAYMITVVGHVEMSWKCELSCFLIKSEQQLILIP